MVEMKKLVLKVGVHDDNDKMKALKAVSSLPGIESIAMDMKEQKLTVIGDVDPVAVVGKLRKSWNTNILTVGPAKEPEKKDGGDAAKKDGEKAKDGDGDGDKKVKSEKEVIEDLVKAYKAYNPYLTHPYYAKCHSVEENPNACVIS